MSFFVVLKGINEKELEMIKKMLEYKYEDISSITRKIIEEIGSKII